ncbi:MAG: polysaccharide biosynthesis protein, partial [Clostridia bacterium]|nr:polysaccharide biosynthesis protein [Clostridia bacterium]
HKIFRTALILFSVIGLVGTGIMYFGAGLMASFIKNPGVELSLKSLSLSIFFVALASIIRGYFQGYCDMRPQANSQILDQLAKCFFTIWLTWLFIGNNPEVMAAAATFGSTIGTFVSLAYLVVYYKRRQKSIKEDVASTEVNSNESRKYISLKLISLAIPIMLGAVITSIAGLVNLFTVIPRLLVAGKTQEEAQILYGMITGKSDTILNLPLALNVVYATSLVPNISRAFALKDYKDAAKKINFSIFSTVLITLPAAVGISVLADPIIKMIFPTAPLGGFYVNVSAYAVVFIALAQTLSGALQGMGKVAVPAIALFSGAVLKYIMNYILVAQNTINILGFEIEMNVMGAAYSTIACYLLTFLISFTVLKKNIELNFNYIKCFVKPVIASAVMGVVTYYTYSFCFNYLASNTKATLISICVGVAVYGIMILLVRAFSNDELQRLPVVGKVFGKIFSRGK